MSRREARAARTEEAQHAAVPEWVRTYHPADWHDPTDEQADAFADLAATWGTPRARQVRAHARWADARRAWRDRHGVTLKEARAR